MWSPAALIWFQNQGEGSSLMGILPIIGIFAIMYFLILRPQIKQQKEHQKLVDQLKKGDLVITNGGIWGEVDAVEAKTVKLKINEKNKILVSRSAIAGFQPKEGEAEAK